MDLQQAKIILDKINRLYKSMQLDERNIDVFEQDLMLSYIKQLYDSFDDEAVSAPTPIKRTVTRRARPVIKETPPPPPPPAPPVEVVRPAAPVVREQAPPPPPPAPVVVEAPKVVVPEPPKVYTPPPPPPAPPAPTTNPEHEVLFEHQEAKELSERLSSQPIKDLNKAIGINEKILTVNELFDKDNAAYNSAIAQLNALPNFEAAKVTLSQLAEKHKWTQRNKKKKAQVFIKLVRRRYL